ncbi:hypothetical protein AB0L05_16860 [Nonomuraea pusilla]|uniref:hypothetical protein n=1 Tax=Nonomuraea pusilla TaxID=46177 RepID=UPI0033273EE4
MHEANEDIPQLPESLESDPLAHKLLRWLTTQGYPLEMRIARAFLDLGRVTQSGYYHDSEADCYREIDVQVGMRSDMEKDPWLEVTLCIEAKSSTEKPWVLFCMDHDSPLHPIAAVVQRFCSAPMREWLERQARFKEVRKLPLFDIELSPGYSLVRASLGQSQGEDVAYKAVLSSVKACHWATTRTDTEPHANKFLIMAIPVIVIDAPLFKCTLNEQGKLQLSRTNIGTLIWHDNRLVPTAPPNIIVSVVTEAGLPEFVERVRSSVEPLIARYEEN